MVKADSLGYNRASGFTASSGGRLTDAFDKSSGFSAGQSSSFSSSFTNIFNQQNQPAVSQPAQNQKSLIGTLMPGVKAQASPVKASSKTRNVNEPASDVGQATRDLSAGKAEIEGVRDNLKNNWDKGQIEVMKAIKEVAPDPATALAGLIPNDSPTKISAAVTVLGDAAFGGGGSMVTMGAQALSGVREISQQGKKLSPDEQRALLEDVQRYLVSSAEQRAQGLSGTKLVASSSSSFQWQNMGPEKLARFLKESFENQPEVEKLDDQWATVDDALATNEAVIENQYDTPTLRKVEVAVQGDNDGALAAMGLKEAPAIDAGETLFHSGGLRLTSLKFAEEKAEEMKSDIGQQLHDRTTETKLTFHPAIEEPEPSINNEPDQNLKLSETTTPGPVAA